MLFWCLASLLAGSCFGFLLACLLCSRTSDEKLLLLRDVARVIPTETLHTNNQMFIKALASESDEDAKFNLALANIMWHQELTTRHKKGNEHAEQG